MKARMSEIIEKLTPDQCEHFAYALEQVASCYLSSSSHGALLIAAAIKKLHLVGLLKVSKSKKPSTTKFHSTWFKARFAETCKFTARNQVRKSHEVLRQTGFETAFRGQCQRRQSGAQSKKPRVVRGLRLPFGLLSRFEVFVLAGNEGYERSVSALTVCYPTFQISPKHLPNQQLLALSRVELFLLLNSPRRGVKKNGTF